MRVREDVVNCVEVLVVGDNRSATVDVGRYGVRHVTGVPQRAECVSVPGPVCTRHQRKDLHRQRKNLLQRRLAKTRTQVKVRGVVDGKHVEFMQSVERSGNRQRPSGNFCKKLFGLKETRPFNRLCQGVNKQD